MALLIWRGPSQLDGKEILLVLTGHDTPTTNTKTGPVLQTWILVSDQQPGNAVRSGADVSICGHCPNRHHTGGGCYVLPWQGPSAVWRSAQGQKPYLKLGSELQCYYADIPNQATALRLGSYGDPMAVPVKVWQTLQDLVGGLPIIGYTHQWPSDLTWHSNLSEHDMSWYRQHLQASTESPEGDLLASSLGWSTFRILPGGQTPLPGSRECLSVNGLTCDQCRLCSTGNHIWIRPHGVRKGRFNPNTKEASHG